MLQFIESVTYVPQLHTTKQMGEMKEKWKTAKNGDRENERQWDGKWRAKGDASANFPHIFMILYLNTLIQIIACTQQQQQQNTFNCICMTSFFLLLLQRENKKKPLARFSVEHSQSDLCHLGVSDSVWAHCKKSKRQIAQSMEKREKNAPHMFQMRNRAKANKRGREVRKK